MIKKWLLTHLIRWLTTPLVHEKKHLSDFSTICNEIRPADILLIEGRSRISAFIQSVTQSAWSHAIIYIGCLNDISSNDSKQTIKKYYQGSPKTPLIIESLLGYGTIVRPLTTYEHEHIRICRPRGLQGQDADSIVNSVCSELGKEYNIQHILALLLFLLPYRLIPRRWLNNLFNHYAKDTMQVICSAMIAHAFNQVDFPILPDTELDNQNNIRLIKRNPSLYTPRDFDHSPYFAVIKYPIFSLSKRYNYHDLPWKNGVFSNDHLGHHSDQKNKSSSE